MSVSRWAYIPERCDGDVCVGDCDLCSKAQDNIALIEEDNDVVDDLIRRADAVALASGGCHPANLAEEIAKLPSAQPEIIRCKDCKYFERDHIENVKGIPLIMGHEFCARWCGGAKTSETGYCFLAERKGNG